MHSFAATTTFHSRAQILRISHHVTFSVCVQIVKFFFLLTCVRSNFYNSILLSKQISVHCLSVSCDTVDWQKKRCSMKRRLSFQFGRFVILYGCTAVRLCIIIIVFGFLLWRCKLNIWNYFSFNDIRSESVFFSLPSTSQVFQWRRNDFRLLRWLSSWMNECGTGHLRYSITCSQI